MMKPSMHPAKMKPSMHPAAPDHLPGFIVAPGEVDVLFVAVAILLTIAIVIIALSL